jgi:hypothetical protein
MPPRLLIFAPCDKVIIDAQTNNLSLISVFQDLNVELPPQEEVPEGRLPVIVMKWDVVSLWLRDHNDPADKPWDVRFQLFDPSDKALPIRGRATMVFGDKLTLRSHVTILGFPLSGEGRYTLRLWMQEQGQPEGEPLVQFPMTLTRSEPKS